MRKRAKVAIVGGGIAGSTAALYLSRAGLDVTLFEQGKSLVSGPPMCHLHAGGNLYREISDEQCVTLLKQSIELLRFYPYAIDYRPTVIAVPIEDGGKPEDLFPRLKMLRREYAALIDADPRNRVLGESSDYFKLYSRSEMEALRELESVDPSADPDGWMVPVAKNIDFDKVQFPLILVQEYGINLFRLGAGITLSLRNLQQCRLLFDTKVVEVAEEEGQGWKIRYRERSEEVEEAGFDYLINAAGFRSGEIDDMLGFHRDRLVEFKAAYVSKWESTDTLWPEVVFYGERGTPRGMAQFTPYPGGYFQLHGMTKDITLFEDGLVKSSPLSAQPRLDGNFLAKIDRQWKFTEVMQRSHSAIHHMSQFIPAFESAGVASKPLYGAQQIPGADATLRAADVSFEGERYARCEIVKASSVLTMTDAIVERLVRLGYVESSLVGKRDFGGEAEDEKRIAEFARSLCRSRNYPLLMAERRVAGESA